MITIRLKPMGTKSRKQWKVVVAEGSVARDSRLIEELGYYNPSTNPRLTKIKMDRYEVWVKKGARPTPTVQGIVKRGKK